MRLSGLVPAARKSRLANFLVAAVGLAIASRSDAAALSPAPPESIRLVEALQAQGNLEKIMLALHNYNDAFGCLPPAYVADSGGRPLYSWRVLLLPFLDQDDSYRGFDLTRAWNDAANLPILEQMPDVYRGAVDPPRSTTTRYAGVSGNGTFFDAAAASGRTPVCGALRLPGSFADGVSNTFAVGEVARAGIPWTAPLDVDVVAHPALGDPAGFSSDEGGFVPFAVADGAVAFVPACAGAQDLSRWFTLADGQPTSPAWSCGGLPTVADLYTLVLEFHTAGSLDGDVASGMLAVLSACESRIARAKVKPAVSLLGAFKAQAAAAIDRGSLDPDQGRLLIDTASALADQLESGP